MVMQDEEFLASLLAMFKEEAKEHVLNLSNFLITLQSENNEDIKKRIIENGFREAHSLKGAARSVNKKNIEILCKQIESVFSILKKERITLEDEVFKKLHLCLDTVNLLIDQEDENNFSTQTAQCLKSLEPFLKGHSVDNGFLKEEKVLVTKTKDEENIPEELLKRRVNETKENTKISVEKLIDTISNIEEFLYLKHTFDKYFDYSNELLDLQKTLKDNLKGEKEKNILNSFEYILEKNIKSLKDEKNIVSNMVDKLLAQSKELLLFPFEILLETFPKMVYDISNELGKKTVLSYGGENIQCDKRIIDRLKDPFIHIIRNILDHGIEDEKERISKNKQPQGQIQIDISLIENSKVKIQIKDDGKGFDIEKIVLSALKNKIVSKSDLESMSEQEKLNLAFASGVTTNEMVTNLSGRGLGLAIVKEKVVQLNGEVYLLLQETGSCMVMELPLVIATYRGILLEQNKQKFILPVSNIEQTLILNKNAIQTVEGTYVAFIENQMLPLYFLGEILGYQNDFESEKFNAFVLNVQDNKILLIVDSIIEKLEVLTKSLGSQLQKVPLISAATVLNDTSVALVLNPLDILTYTSYKRASGAKEDQKELKEEKKSILMVDDSLTTRILMKNILEASGYNVSVAVDGLDAFSTLTQKPFDLIVSDVDMPNMNGFELTKKIKNDPKFENIPVILLTSLESKEDKEKGMNAGANAYIVKSGFDQKKLMETIEWMI